MHLVAAGSEDVLKNWRTVREELTAYGRGIEKKPEILVVSHADTLPKKERPALKRALQKATGQAPVFVSSVSGEGVKNLCATIFKKLH